MTNKRKTNGKPTSAKKGKVVAELKNVEGVTENENIKIPLDDLIPVISLINYPLNLSTLGNGQGKVIRFESFSQRKQILYQDLLNIMEFYRSFMEQGVFYILDKRVIRAHGLQEIYEKILNKEKIELILAGSKEGLGLYNSCNPEQQKIIIGMVIELLRDKPDEIDLNVVDQLSRASGVKILEKAEDARNLMKPQADKEE